LDDGGLLHIVIRGAGLLIFPMLVLELSSWEASVDRFQGLWISPDLLWCVLAGDDDLLMSQCDHTSFSLTGAIIVIAPELEMIVQVLSSLRVDVLQEDDILALVTVKPLVAQLFVTARIFFPGSSALAIA